MNGQLATFATLNRDSKLSMTLTVTPADYTTCTWFLDGVKVNEGKTIEQQLEAGTYDLKIVATTTAGKSTSRRRTRGSKTSRRRPHDNHEEF